MIAQGWLTPPPGAGLGVELNWDAVRTMEVKE
jgi:L-alanine-DL-glutamate epimerase-like enolase superfamily enzyme